MDKNQLQYKTKSWVLAVRSTTILIYCWNWTGISINTYCNWMYCWITYTRKMWMLSHTSLTSLIGAADCLVDPWCITSLSPRAGAVHKYINILTYKNKYSLFDHSCNKQTIYKSVETLPYLRSGSTAETTIQLFPDLTEKGQINLHHQSCVQQSKGC